MCEQYYGKLVVKVYFSANPFLRIKDRVVVREILSKIPPIEYNNAYEPEEVSTSDWIFAGFVGNASEEIVDYLHNAMYEQLPLDLIDIFIEKYEYVKEDDYSKFIHYTKSKYFSDIENPDPEDYLIEILDRPIIPESHVLITVKSDTIVVPMYEIYFRPNLEHRIYKRIIPRSIVQEFLNKVLKRKIQITRDLKTNQIVDIVNKSELRISRRLAYQYLNAIYYIYGVKEYE